MAPISTSGLLGGGVLVRTGFASASDEFKNFILMLETAGLSFVLEHPCKVLDKKVLEFFQNDKLRHEDTANKSKVQKIKVKVKASLLTRYLRLLVCEEADYPDEGDFSRDRLFYGLPRDIMVLQGDFNNEDDEDSTGEEFENHVVKEREGKRPLLTGDLKVTLKEGM
ncbi:hypothetical protein KSP40_PGU000268 [Platanthera guangdongensis]|uniref:Calmodulin binding protein-like N-terminal domain-containing protein n=1 Tax=Platanthera guangdongensis TaxID=2320717 RepID=A0ABR2MX90_9ASPA